MSKRFTKDIIMFRNLIHIRKQFKNYKVTKKIQYVWLSALTILGGALLGIKGWFI